MEEHTWEWKSDRWICADCGAVASSTDAHYQPCLGCGAAVGMEELCDECAGAPA